MIVDTHMLTEFDCNCYWLRGIVICNYLCWRWKIIPIVLNSDPHWARRNLAFVFVCFGECIVETCASVCVCALTYPWIWQWGGENTRFGVATNHQEIEGVMGHLCLLHFIFLIKICIKIGLKPEMDSGIWLCVGKVLGTPRHLSIDGYLPHVYLCVFDHSAIDGVHNSNNDSNNFITIMLYVGRWQYFIYNIIHSV